jgi:hypothetical protein
MADDPFSEDSGGTAMEAVRHNRKAQLELEAKALDQLHASVMSTHQHATAMHRELNDQDRLLNNLDRGVGAANQETRAQTRSIGHLVEQTKTHSFLVAVAVLVLIIIILLWI